MTCVATGRSSLCGDVVFAVHIVLMAGRQDCSQKVSNAPTHAGCMPTCVLRCICTPRDGTIRLLSFCEDTTGNLVVAQDEASFPV